MGKNYTKEYGERRQRLKDVLFDKKTKSDKIDENSRKRRRCNPLRVDKEKMAEKSEEEEAEEYNYKDRRRRRKRKR